MNKHNGIRLLMAFGAAALMASPAIAAKPSKKKDVKPVVSNYDFRMQQRREAAIARLPKLEPVKALSSRRVGKRSPESLALSERTIKHEVEVIRLVDGMVVYYPGGGQAVKKKTETNAQWRNRLLRLEKTAILRGDAITHLRGKVGDVVKLHLKTDSKGFAYVVNVSR